jgi:hypothetical protein
VIETDVSDESIRTKEPARMGEYSRTLLRIPAIVPVLRRWVEALLTPSLCLADVQLVVSELAGSPRA